MYSIKPQSDYLAVMRKVMVIIGILSIISIGVNLIFVL